jgi:hypothetical protein
MDIVFGSPKTKRPKLQEVDIISSLNLAIEALDFAKEIASVTPAKAAFGSVSIILGMIRVCFLLVRVARPHAHVLQDSMVNDLEYVELGLACSNVCTALNRGVDGKKLKDLNESVCEAIKQLTR